MRRQLAHVEAIGDDELGLVSRVGHFATLLVDAQLPSSRAAAVEAAVRVDAELRARKHACALVNVMTTCGVVRCELVTRAT